MASEDPRPMVFALLNSIEPGVKLVETVSFKLDKKKEKRFLELVERLENHAEYLLYEVWKDRNGLKQQWESDSLNAFQRKLMSENLLLATPELKFFLH